jgi:hypothetical protein
LIEYVPSIAIIVISATPLKPQATANQMGKRHTRIFRINRRWVLHKINLKPHKMRRLPHLIQNRNHSKQIHKRLTALPIIDQTNLRLTLCCNAILQIQHRIIIAVFSFDAGCDAPVRGLEESAVLTDDFVARVACQAFKGFGGVFDGGVVDFGVADYEGAGEVYSANVYLGVWATGDFDLFLLSVAILRVYSSNVLKGSDRTHQDTHKIVPTRRIHVLKLLRLHMRPSRH